MGIGYGMRRGTGEKMMWFPFPREEGSRWKASRSGRHARGRA
jgi:hypothetical protein